MSNGEEKTERPTEQRLKDARNKGQVAKSTDAVALSSLFFALLVLFLLMPLVLKRWSIFFASIHMKGYGHVSKEFIKGILHDAINLWIMLSLPIVAGSILGAGLGTVGQFGFLLTSHPIKPDIKRINPISGFKKMFSKDRLVELIKQILKFTAISSVILFSIRSLLPSIMLLFRVDFASSLLVMSDFLLSIFIKVLLCFLAIAILDIFWQRHSFIKSMRMSKYEVKKEYIQQEGDPHIKQERRRFAQEIQETAAKPNIEEAAVVITNPNHVAVAIRYCDENDEVPILVAKGVGRYAKYLIRDANDFMIPIVRNVPLARDLQWLDINEEIPDHLYDSVAEVLLFVHELNNRYEEANEDQS